jgi:hypothetical protein
MSNREIDYERRAPEFAAATDLDKLSADIAAQNDQLNKDIAGRKRAAEKVVAEVAEAFADRPRAFFVDEIPQPLYADDNTPDDEDDPEDVTSTGFDEEARSVSIALPEYDDEIDDGEKPEGPDESTAQWLVDAGPDTKLVLIMVKTGTEDPPIPVCGLKVYSPEAEDGVFHIAGPDVAWTKVDGFRYEAQHRVWVGAVEHLVFRLQCAVEGWMKTRTG